MRDAKKLKGLYVITDDILTPHESLLESVEKTLLGGAKIIQLRDKKSTDKQISDISLKLQELCQRYGAVFILNDKVDIAIKLNLSGLHVGKSDHHQIKKIRNEFDGYLGVSCYGDINLALLMQEIGVDYVAFGSCFSSPTKPNSTTIDIEIIKIAKEKLTIPICTIGGINSANINTLMKYNPDMVAIINDIWKSDDVMQKSKYFQSLFQGK